MDKADYLKQLVEDLTGQTAPLESRTIKTVGEKLDEGTGLGLSQFNELLLLSGYDRVKHAFFQYLVDGSAKCKPQPSINSFHELKEGIDRFQKLALLMFGNVKYGFKRLSREPDYLWECVESWKPIPSEVLRNRHEPILPIETIDGKDTYYLGYLIEREIEKRLEKDPLDSEALQEEEQRIQIVELGKRNHKAYLASDHLDVYVATSMRKRHEYLMVHDFVKQIFGDKKLAGLNLRWFDPTQAYCKERIDKGLAEGLMLKRARCTLYFVQESDTFGKDSELASTLAQGKPVVAFVPEGNDEFVHKLMNTLESVYPNRARQETVIEQLHVFEPDAAWADHEVRRWLDQRGASDSNGMMKRLQASGVMHK